MAVVLEYAGQSVGRRGTLLSPFSLQLLLTYTHVNLCWQFSRLTIASVCSHMHADFLAWTPVAWLPGSLAGAYLGKGLGMALMFLCSIVAGKMMQGLLARYRDSLDTPSDSLIHDWRTWATAVLWLGWIPVPAIFAFAYQFSEWATQRG